ncbi:MAG TPA: magnesium-translocating P-type ATPase [Gammaproteobacteria bacterium]|nr:magnesium-translocating P-type ATPase [Gammaproteobacteria bacterium]
MAGYWAKDAASVTGALESTPTGLHTSAAAQRLLEVGLNTLRREHGVPGTRLLLRQFESPLVLILVFAAGVAAVVQDWTNAVTVLAIVLASGLLSFWQEFRASKAVERLRERVTIKSTVLRDGVEAEVPSETIVPGDIVLLRAGTLIPADGVLLEAKDLFVTQAALTGEAVPVEKRPGPCAADAGLAERTNCVFMGTSVRSGTGRALIVRTGESTVYGGIAKRLRLRAPETEFERGIRRYGQLLTRVMTFLVLLVFTANVLLARPPVDSLLFAIALAVGLSPELLPAIISVTLSAGARDMAARGVIVRRLSSIENFGSMDILCADKTGTLTEGTMSLERALDASGADSRAVLADAFLNSLCQSGLPNALDEAIVAAGRSTGVDASAYRKLDEVPYDFLRKRLTIVVQRHGERDSSLMITKGAFGSVLDACMKVRADGGTAPLDAVERDRLVALFEQWSGAGYRVLGLAVKEMPWRPAYDRSAECDLTFRGFLLFRDPPKKGIEQTLAALSGRGVTLKIITGDNRTVTMHLGRAVGFRSPRVLSGADLQRLSDEALMRLAPDTDFFVEVEPNQKERIILALKKAGHVVGFLGDGINDAAALHAADVGICVDEAADVAKEAADFVLLEHDLDVLRRGVEQGRRTFANTLKYIEMTTSANFGNMLSMAAASFFLPFLPLLAKQILLNNFLSDIPAMAIAGDRVDPELIDRPRRWDMRSIRDFAFVFGTISSVFDFVTFGALLYVFRAGPELFRTGWFVESLLTELAIVLIIRTRQPFYRSRPGRLLLASTLIVMAVTVAIPYLPVAAPMGFVPLSIGELAALLLIMLLYLAASELAKAVFYRRAPERRRGVPG